MREQICGAKCDENGPETVLETVTNSFDTLWWILPPPEAQVGQIIGGGGEVIPKMEDFRGENFRGASGAAKNSHFYPISRRYWGGGKIRFCPPAPLSPRTSAKYPNSKG